MLTSITAKTITGRYLEGLASLYEWLDSVPLSCERTSMEKDFADGCMAAEVVKFYFPSIVNLHDYRPSPSIQDRIAQWKMLNVRVFRHIGLIVPSHMATQLSICKSGTAQILLSNLRASLTIAGANTYGARYKSVMHRDYIPVRPPFVLRRDEMQIDDPDEVIYLRTQVRHMEALLQAKDAKIYDLQDEISESRRGYYLKIA